MILSIIMEYYQLLSEKYNLPVELYLYIWGFINNDELLSLKIKKDDPVWNGRIPNIRSYFVTIIKNEICQKNGHCMEYYQLLSEKYNLPPELYLYIWSFTNNDELLSLKIKKDDPVWNGRIPNIRSYFLYFLKYVEHVDQYFLTVMDNIFCIISDEYDEYLWYLYDNNNITYNYLYLHFIEYLYKYI